MGTLAVKFKRAVSLLLVAVMLCSFSFSASAYYDSRPNTHRNSGKHIADLIAVASGQIGYVELDPASGQPLHPESNVAGYTKYGESFGAPKGEWCAYFVSWCATTAGIPTSIVPRLGNCASTVEWYKKHSVYRPASSGYVPKPGDIIFFNWSGGSTAKHIGIVTGVSGNNVYTIEGNTGPGRGNQCMSKTRSRTAGYIVGYGVPAYNDASYNYGSNQYPNSGSQSGSVKYAQLAVITTSATEITSTTALLHGEIRNSGRFNISSSGFFFGTDKTKLKKYPVNSSTTATNIKLEMDAASKVGELTPNTTYYYQSYAVISGKTYPGPMYAVVTVNDCPQQLMLSDISTTVGLGRTINITATPLPYGTQSKGFVWKSSDEKIVTVTNEGAVTGVSYGTAKLTATTNYGSVSADCSITVLIPTPENVKATTAGENNIRLSWSPVDSAEGYIIYRNEDDISEMAEIARVDAGTTAFDDSTVTPGSKYNYRIVTIAKDEQYNSELSQTASAVARLCAPSKISASHEDNWINISWNAIGGAQKYYVYRATSENGLYTNIGKTYANKFVDRTALPEQDYYYKVFADNGDMRTRSEFSPSAMITTKVVSLETAENRFLTKQEELHGIDSNEASIVRCRTKGFIAEF